jgi:tripartite-type tricarboxylate transporter receptor subunit TctC
MSGARRSYIAPDMPTFAEAGLPQVEYTGWISIFATGGTPRDVLAKVADETSRALRMPDIVEKIPGWGGEAAGTTPDEFAARYRGDIEKYARIVKAAGVKLQD